MKTLMWIGISIGLVVFGVSFWFHISTGTLPLSFHKSYLIQVKDKETGKPISGVISEIEWIEERISLEIERPDFGKILIMSDKDGQIRIPWKLGLHPFSFYHEIVVHLHHPFYKSKTIAQYAENVSINDESHRKYNDVWLKEPIELTLERNESFYQGSKCIGKRRLNEGLFEETCTGNAASAPAMLWSAEEYFQTIETKTRIQKYDTNLHPTKKEVYERIKPIIMGIYSSSPDLPYWVDRLDEKSK